MQWPDSDKIVRAPKNGGITATILQTPGAIGYIQYGYAKLTGTPMAMLKNASGEFVAPGGEAGAAALGNAEFDTHMRAFVTDPQGESAYPIATFTWMLFFESGQDPEGRGHQRDDRVRPHRRPCDGRGSRLHPAARKRYRSGARRRIPDRRRLLTP